MMKHSPYFNQDLSTLSNFIREYVVGNCESKYVGDESLDLRVRVKIA